MRANPGSLRLTTDRWTSVAKHLICAGNSARTLEVGSRSDAITTYVSRQLFPGFSLLECDPRYDGGGSPIEAYGLARGVRVLTVLRENAVPAKR